MKRPDRAIILAAGFGSRMKPLALQRPKPLMPFDGKPLLEHAIDLLASWGVKHICINAHYRAGQLMKWVVDHPRDDVTLNLSYEPEILNTGGPLKRASWFIHDQPFWLFNADVMAHCDPELILKAFKRKHALAAWWVTDEAGPRTVEVENDLVTNMASHRPGSEGTYTFTGLHLIHPRLLDYIPDEKHVSIITAYKKAMQAGERLAAVSCPGSYWADVGKPGDFLAAHKSWSDFCTGRPGRRRKKSHGKEDPSVCWDQVTLKKGARLDRVIVGDRTTVWGTVQHVAVPANETLTEQELKALEKAGLNTRDACAEFLPARPSERALIRVQRGRRSVMLVRYNPNRRENTLYVPLTRRLHNGGLQVPAVVSHHEKPCFSLIEDLGRTDLKQAIEEASTATKKRYYRRAIDQAALLHRKGRRLCRGIALQPGFDATLYRWERNYFAEHFLQGELGWSDKKAQAFARAAAGLAKNLLQGPQAIIHRDLQSSNVLVYKRQCWLIDYQGMRVGSPAYDLASLLLDPYVCLPETLQQELLDYYLEQSEYPFTEQLFWEAAAQRLLQALGAYGRLGRQPATAGFAKHIGPGLLMLERSVQNLKKHGSFCEQVVACIRDYGKSPC